MLMKSGNNLTHHHLIKHTNNLYIANSKKLAFLNTPKAHQEGFYQVILSKNSENSELKPEFKLCTFQRGEFSIDNRCDKHFKKLQ